MEAQMFSKIDMAMKLECVAMLSARYGISREYTAYDCAVKALNDVIWAIKVNRLPQLHASLFTATETFRRYDGGTQMS